VIFNQGRPITGGPIALPFDLGSFGTPNSLAYAINDRSHIAGVAATASGPSHAFFHTTGLRPLNQATDDLGTLGGTNSAACCVNNVDLVAGWSDVACPIKAGPLQGGQVTHAVLWQPATRSRRDLGTEPPEPQLPKQVRDMSGHLRTVYWARTRERGPDSDGGRAMNNRIVAKQPSPQIVGYSELFYGPLPPKGWNKYCILYDTSFRIAFMFDGTMHNLNDMIPATSGWFLQEAWGINDRGQIVGHGYLRGASHAFLLLP
jgi:probable HAF family extracellular repeat protein